MIPYIKYGDDTPNLKVTFNIIVNQISDGGMRLGLPFCPEGNNRPAFFDGVDVVFSQDAPKRVEQLNNVILKACKQKIQILFDSFPRGNDSPKKWALHNQIKILESVINKDGIVETPIYGEFICKPKPMVLLYWGNIKNDRKPYLALEATLVHELFHAWNYFCSDVKPRCIPEIDEALVEYATLSFLEKLSESNLIDSGIWMSHYRDVFSWQLNAVNEKQLSVGILAAYGFGAYIFEKDSQKELLRVYPALSGTLSASDPDVQMAVSLLNPLYPVCYEDLTLKHIKDALNRKLPNNNRIHIPLTITSYPPSINTPSSMTSTERTLFWEIINCGLNNYAKSGPCQTVIDSQNAASLGAFHVPEPWNGNLSSAKILFVSINPGYSAGELYPRTGLPYWTPSGKFDQRTVEDFFENRFSPGRYVSYKDGGHSFKIKMENGTWKSVSGFWNYIFQMAKVLRAASYKDFAITELVHCKSNRISSLSGSCY